MASTQDEAFREIQLSGKQLVFLFMAVVVIAVVIFLTGVQVGRGVLAQRGLPEASDPVADAGDEPPLAPASGGQGSDAPITASEKLSYAERLNAATPASEPLKVTEPAPADAAPTPKPEAPAPAEPAPAATAAAAPAASASSEPAGTGYAIQVAALRSRNEADVIVKRLASKGYPAYVVAPAPGAPSVYRVRVGKYKDRREADTVAARLTKEEQFKPWVVR
jgi:cell division septation protein DedD